jgi:hypothetical protein
MACNGQTSACDKPKPKPKPRPKPKGTTVYV